MHKSEQKHWGLKPLKSKSAKFLIWGTGCLFVATAAVIVWYHIAPMDWLLSTAISVGTTFYHFVMRMFAGAVVPHRDWTKCRWFRQRPWEPKLYAALHVKRWKGRMPTYDPDLFSLEENTLTQIIQNSCRAEVIHEVIIVLSFLPVMVIPRFGAAVVFWLTSLFAAAFDCLFVVMQRYNRPRLERILSKEIHRL